MEITELIGLLAGVVVWLIILPPAVWALAMLITREEITADFRSWVEAAVAARIARKVPGTGGNPRPAEEMQAKSSRLVYLINCPKCTSHWVALISSLIAWFGTGRPFGLVVLALLTAACVGVTVKFWIGADAAPPEDA